MGGREARKFFLCCEQCLNGSVTCQERDSGRERTNETTVNKGRLMSTEARESSLSKTDFPVFLSIQGKTRNKICCVNAVS